MDILLDNPETDRVFRELLNRIPRLKNGATVAQMKALGAQYRVNWGVSVVSLRDLARLYPKDHLLALKLWNKQWRESMILATLLEDPETLSEEQMDYWTKHFDTAEIAEQAVANLFVYSRFAFAKALEYGLGKKHWVRYTGLLLMGRLAMIDKNAIDELFDTFFEILTPLAKDPMLASAFYRSMVLVANRSEYLYKRSVHFLETLRLTEEKQAKQMAGVLLDELKDPDRELFKESGF